MSVLLDPADGPRREEYTKREIRLMRERDAALQRAESAESAVRRLRSHPCDRDDVRRVVLRLAKVVEEFYSAPGGPDEPNPDEFISKRDALVVRLESVLARRE